MARPTSGRKPPSGGRAASAAPTSPLRSDLRAIESTRYETGLVI